MKTWFCGRYVEVKKGQKVFIGYCGRGRTVFGEYGILKDITDKYLVFQTDNGLKVKTAADNLSNVKGKAGKQRIFVSPVTDREFIEVVVSVY